MRLRLLASARIGLLCLAFAASAGAQLPADGQPIKTNRYGVDLFQGPVLAGTRPIGVAGAFVAIGEGVEGDTQNPASPAVRVPWSSGHFDYDLGFGVTFPATLKNSDFFNSGKRTDLPKGSTGEFVFLNVAANLQFGKWGLGVTSDLQRYALSRDTSDSTDKSADQLVAQISITHIQLARAFADGQLIIGVGDRIATLAVENNSPLSAAQQSLFSTVGNGYEVGFLWRPNGSQFRVGGAFRSGVTTRPSPDDAQTVLYRNDPANQLYLPDHVTVPWDLDVGVAVQLGPRPLNPLWRDPALEIERCKRFLRWRELERARRRRFELARVENVHGDVAAAANALDSEFATEAALDDATLSQAERDVDAELRRRHAALERFHVLLLGSVVVSGSASNAVGVESFLERTVQHSGASLSYSPRVGVETESVPHWLRLRAGSYYEPTRFPSNHEGGRPHGTFGFDAKLFPFDVFGLFHEGTTWRAGGSLDAARNYFGWSVAIGVWH
ncbi:MAG: hypothetical protein ABJB12_04380 [Pseudomonadota bacterium]